MLSLLDFPVISIGIGAALIYLITVGIYRLYFHPLAKFPGPKLAALTRWYEFYHDVINHGKFIWKIQELHDRYGPIVRITPDELHIKDSEYYEEIYAGSSKKRDKYEEWVTTGGARSSTFATVSHDLHRLRRSILNPFFSKRSITNMEPRIKNKIENLAERFMEVHKSGEVVRLDAAFLSLTMDIICEYAYGEDFRYLASPDFSLKWKEAILNVVASGAFLRQFPWVFHVLQAIPLAFLEAVNTPATALVEWQKSVEHKVDIIIANNQLGKKVEGTIFQALIDSELPPHEKTRQRLVDEGQVIVAAGSETTAKSLSFITFYLIQDEHKHRLQKLRDELKTVMPGPTSDVSLAQLEQLPYLTAVINEGIRLMYGTTTRLPRISRHEPMVYQDWVIPPGTPVSQSHYFIHHDPAIFPNPDQFEPERWIRAADQGIRLDKYLVSFSKGSRSCAGIYLAYAEMYLTLAIIMRRFEIENFETTWETDIKLDRDFMVGMPKPESKGIRAKIIGLVDM